ncbi:hypothetical protein ACFL96_01340 [Thermoproteota archaeon]
MKAIRKNLHIVMYEKYKNENTSTFIERQIAKHPFLKPELIVVNDQIHGFKEIESKFRSLEAFPIFLEVEYSVQDENEKIIESVDLYAEVKFEGQNRVNEIRNMARLYKDTIMVENVKQINEISGGSYIIYSRINDIFADTFLEHDNLDSLMSPSELEVIFELNLVSFTNFIKHLDDILIKGKHLDPIDQAFRTA